MRPLGWVSGAALAAVSGLAGCDGVLGIHDVSLDPGAGGASAHGGGGGGATTTGHGGGGMAPAQGDFTFAIKSASANVPYGGLSYVEVEIERLNGFNDAVNVAVQGAPTGLNAAPITVPAGATGGKLQVGASGALVLGTTFTLKLIATSNSLSHTDTVPAVVTGKPGTLDTSFGTGGISPPLYSQKDAADVYDLRETPDHKILAAGDAVDGLGGSQFRGARLLQNGQLDTTFNMSGTISGGFCSCAAPYDQARSVLRLLNGAVFFLGTAGERPMNMPTIQSFGLLRYTDAGVADNSDHDGGKEFLTLGTSTMTTTSLSAAALSSKEDIYVTGGRDGRLFVARIRTDWNSLDANYAAPNGWVVPDVGGQSSSGAALALDAMDRPVVVGSSTTAGEVDAIVVRLTTGGALDTSFGTGGVVTVHRTAEQTPIGIAVQTDGRILVASLTKESGSAGVLVLRFTSTGMLDATFGEGGAAVLTASGDSLTPVAMALMLDGRIVVGGNQKGGPFLARFLDDGTPDPTFGDGGIQGVYFGTSNTLQSLWLTADGKLLLGGSIEGYPYKAVIARVWN